MQTWREREKAVKTVIRSLPKVMKRRNVYMEVKKGLRNSMLLVMVHSQGCKHGIGHSSQYSVLSK